MRNGVTKTLSFDCQLIQLYYDKTRRSGFIDDSTCRSLSEQNLNFCETWNSNLDIATSELKWWKGRIRMFRSVTGLTGSPAPGTPSASRRARAAGSRTPRPRCLHPGTWAGWLRRKAIRCVEPAQRDGGGGLRTRRAGRNEEGRRGRWGTDCGVEERPPAAPGRPSAGTNRARKGSRS